ncbi:MAG TPA: DUF2934 domain-containing protein [Steroidobacteraceae bacterium]|jgi:hypothetical protein
MHSQDTPGRPKPSASRQQTRVGQQTQTGSWEADSRHSPAGKEAEGDEDVNYRDRPADEGKHGDGAQEPNPADDRADPSGGKSGASPSGPGVRPKGNAALSSEQHARIAARAYELASRRGFVPGREFDDWLEAERQIEFGPPRNTPPDNPHGPVKTYSNE